MGDEISFSGWTEKWLNRTHEGLYQESIGACYVLTIVSIAIGIKTLFNIRSWRKQLEQNPSDRAAVLAGANKRLLNTHKSYLVISDIWIFHAAGIWLIDTGIFIWAIKESVSTDQAKHDATYWLNSAVQVVSIFAILMATLVAFPLLQWLAFERFMVRFMRTRDDSTLAALVPAARTITTNLAMLWAMLTFFMVAFWPTFLYPFVRILALEAVFGSAYLWLRVSWALNYRPNRFHEVEIPSFRELCGHARLYGTMAGDCERTLPKYEDMPQSQPVVDEKTPL